MKKMYVVPVVLSAMIIAGCASTKVTRTDVPKPVDISGSWNDTDSRLVANEMIEDAVSGRWVDNFLKDHGREPVVIVGQILNRSHEHIDAQVFIKDLERALINSGKVKFVASSSERVDVRDERLAQQEGFTNPATIKAIGMETGADFMLIGSINSVKDAESGRYVIMYQSNLELIDLTTNEKRWIGQKKIKKIVEKKRFGL